MKNLKPLYKWTGGKRKEIKIFDKYFPNFIKNNEKYTYIEPFFGGGAVYWYLANNHKNIINDIDYDLINFLNVLKTKDSNFLNRIKDISLNINKISELEKDGTLDIKTAKIQRGEYYYGLRNLDRNNGLKELSNIDRAIRFFVMTSLAFNGMRRFNSKGEFNIPYGNYKTLSNVELLESLYHHELLSSTNIMNTDFENILIDNDFENTFIFLDPPYTRDFKEYSHGNIFDDNEQIRLSNVLKSLKKSKWMLIINNDDFTNGLYTDYIKDKYSLKYGTNIKNRYSQDTEHLIICNY